MSFRKNLPNYLTYFRMLMIPALVAAFDRDSPNAYIFCAGLFMLASITDWLDGYFARMWQAQSAIGRFLDPIADKLLVATALVLLVGAGSAAVIPAVAIVCREILVSGLREFLAEIRVSMPVSRLAKWKTGVQMTAIFLLLLGPGAPDWLNASMLGWWMLWLAAGLTLVTGYAYLQTGWKHLAGK